MVVSGRATLLAGLAAAAGLSALSGCGGGESSSAAGPDIRGEWHGRLEQRGMQPFEVQATIRSLATGKRSARVHYTGIDCSGHWTLLSRGVRGYRFREVIDRGEGAACKGVGTVRVIPDDQYLDYDFRGGGVESHGVLSRVD